MALHQLDHNVRPLALARIMAIDWGARYTGLAVRTSQHRGALPYGLIEIAGRRAQQHARSTRTLTAGREAGVWELRRDLTHFGGSVSRYATHAEALDAVLDEQRIGAVVVGMPYHADGSLSPECAAVERHVAALRDRWGGGLPILLWDESWSTRRAVGPKRRRDGAAAACSHAAAASIVLREVLGALAPYEQRAGSADSGGVSSLFEELAPGPR